MLLKNKRERDTMRTDLFEKLTTQDVLELTGISQRQLDLMRKKRLIREPQKVPNPKGKGRVSVYCSSVVDEIKMILEMKASDQKWSDDEIKDALWVEGMRKEKYTRPRMDDPHAVVMRFGKDGADKYSLVDLALTKLRKHPHRLNLKLDECRKFNRSIDLGLMEYAARLIDRGLNPFLIFISDESYVCSDLELVHVLSDLPEHIESGFVTIPLWPIFADIFDEAGYGSLKRPPLRPARSLYEFSASSIREREFFRTHNDDVMVIQGND